MADARSLADMASAAGCSCDSVHSMQSSDALQPRTSDPSMRMHRVQAWLVSDKAMWSSMSPHDLALSEGGCDASGKCGAASEGRACAAPAQKTAEHATAQKPIAAKQHENVAASEQPDVLHQLSSDKPTSFQQHVMERSADQAASPNVAGAASQQVSAAAAAAAAAVRQSAVHALVQRFEHMTEARRASSKPGDTGLGLLASALAHKASQQRLSEVKTHAICHMPEQAIDAATVNDDNCSNSSDGVEPRRQPQHSCFAQEEEDRMLQPTAPHDMLWVENSSVCQPPEWHTNTAYELESSSAEQAESDPALTRYAEPTAPGATGASQAAAHHWPEGLDVTADVKEGSVPSFKSCSTSFRTANAVPPTDMPPAPSSRDRANSDAATKCGQRDSDRQQSMQDALHQSLHQVKVCTSQLKELSRQQRAMQLALQIMSTTMQDGILLMQQQ